MLALTSVRTSFCACRSVYGIDGPPWDPNTTISTTAVTRKLRLENATEWRFDFTDVLLFPHLPITTVQYSITIESEGFARHAARPAEGMVVRVVTDEPVTATVTIHVDQAEHSAGSNR